MEGLGDRCFRVALSAAFPGSFDEASTEFLRLTLPSGVDPWSLRARRCFRGMLSAFAYDPQDLRPAPSNGSPRPPLALQLMLSGDQGQLGSAFVRWMLESGDVPPRLHPSRVDINMGCPSRCTTSRGAKLPGGGTTRRLGAACSREGLKERGGMKGKGRLSFLKIFCILEPNIHSQQQSLNVTAIPPWGAAWRSVAARGTIISPQIGTLL